jgi:hypothetical protein
MYTNTPRPRGNSGGAEKHLQNMASTRMTMEILTAGWRLRCGKPRDGFFDMDSALLQTSRYRSVCLVASNRAAWILASSLWATACCLERIMVQVMSSATNVLVLAHDGFTITGHYQ